MNKRIELLRKYMSDNRLDCVLVTDRKNIFYLSSFTGEGYLMITADSLILATDFRYTEQAQIQSPDFTVCDVSDFDLKSLASDFKRTGFENLSISFKGYRSYSKYFSELVPIDSTLMDFRAVKDSQEISCIRTAEKIGDMAFEHILDYLKPGVSERDIALEIEFFMRKNGADALSFDVIAATGAHGAMPHAEPDERLIKNGDFVVLDFGCVYNGYCSDMTRTVCIGKADSEKKKVYNTVLKAQLSSLEMLRCGAVPSKVHENAFNIIDSAYPKSFGHALGHGVGLDIHESPALSPKNSVPLKNGNVVTVEPGIYLSGFCGVRIEDLVLIDGDGVQNLTKSDKNLIEL